MQINQTTSLLPFLQIGRAYYEAFIIFSSRDSSSSNSFWVSWNSLSLDNQIRVTQSGLEFLSTKLNLTLEKLKQKEPLWIIEQMQKKLSTKS